MASITLKDIPTELPDRLKNQAAANSRRITQEAISRIERTLHLDTPMTTDRDQKWIDEALASGPEKALSRRKMDAIRDRILRGKK